MPKICIDAGHWGSYNQSPANPAYFESKIMWQLQELLCAELEKLGVQTVRTRLVPERDLPLEQRGALAEGCGLFLSLHSNATEGNALREDIDYPVSYVSISGSADDIGLRLARCVEQTLGTVQSARIEHKTGSGGKDYYGVLRGAWAKGVAGVILEHSFHTNSRTVRWLMQPENLQILAAREAQIIAEYLGAKIPATPASPAQKRYRYPGDLPESDSFRAIIAELMEAGIIRGDGGTPPVIDLSHDMVRLLVMLHRAGLLDKNQAKNHNKENTN